MCFEGRISAFTVRPIPASETRASEEPRDVQVTPGDTVCRTAFHLCRSLPRQPHPCSPLGEVEAVVLRGDSVPKGHWVCLGTCGCHRLLAGSRWTLQSPSGSRVGGQGFPRSTLESFIPSLPHRRAIRSRAWPRAGWASPPVPCLTLRGYFSRNCGPVFSPDASGGSPVLEG